ncbi:MAG: hypothetical protein GC171_13905 [Terrimonas sp.]|nr:hypothetical protein [Terrimonas sp.]
MLKRRITAYDLPLIIVNLIPVAGVWFFGWEARSIFIVYALETVLIGLFTILKLGVVTLVKGKDQWSNNGQTSQQSGIFFILFFIAHYGLFVAIQMGLFLSISGIGHQDHFGLFGFFQQIPALLNENTIWVLAAFFVMYGYQFLTGFILNKAYTQVSMSYLMFQPYGRIFIQQFTVIAGSFFLAFGSGKLFILIFIAVKLFFDLRIDYDSLIEKAVKDVAEQSGKQ